ncbi:MAG: hydrogenase maturation protein [Roseibium sp.]|nr:hydrogenase maturation protein [Roseibium sp.]
MRILLLCHSFNSLTQRLHCELRAAGHKVSVEFDINDVVTEDAVRLFAPDVILAPFLKRAIPASVFEAVPCLIVHPGPLGDRGPAALDWAILDGADQWGVTVLQAVADLDAGPVWAHRDFPLRSASKSSLYRHEVSKAAVEAVFEALEKFERGETPLEVPKAQSRWRPAVRQSDRAIDWAADSSETLRRKIRSADGMPGVRGELFGEPVFLFDARPFQAPVDPSVSPGTPIARSGPAIGVKTIDGAVWIGHVRKAGRQTVKLPATHVFERTCTHLPEIENGYQDIRFEQDGRVGYLHFDFYNGAMGTDACTHLTAAFKAAIEQPLDLLVLMGGPDHWSNGLNLNLIEAAHSPAEESWQNIQAIDRLAEEIIRTTGTWIVSALCGNAGAGGVFLARAADEVWVHPATVLNPHYKDMGNLYGSEFWTYLLPKYSGAENAARIAEARLPMGAEEALTLGLADQILAGQDHGFVDLVRQNAAARLNETLPQRLAQKAATRAQDEAERPLDAYRAAELARMRKNFFGFDPSYHVARYNFVHKIPKSRTPLTLAHHRATPATTSSAKRVTS